MAGVYRIRNTINGKVYIGSTVRTFSRRWKQHRKCLVSGTHHSAHLQAAWNQYGEAAFVFECVTECLATECVKAEQEQIDDHKSASREHGYNASPTAGNCLGVKHSEKARANMSAASIGKPKSPEAIAKTAAAHRGRPKSKEQREKISASLRGKKQSPETKKKRADTRRGIPLSEEHRRKLSAARRGKKFPQDWRDKIAASKRGVKQTPENIAKRVAAFRETIARRRVLQLCD